MAGGIETIGGRWVSLAEAAAAAGVSRSTLRAWYRDGRLASRLVPGPNGPMREVPLDPVLERARLGDRLAAAARPSPGPGMPADGPPAGGATAVAALEAALLRAEGRADRAEAALRTALQRAARAEAALHRDPAPRDR